MKANKDRDQMNVRRWKRASTKEVSGERGVRQGRRDLYMSERRHNRIKAGKLASKYEESQRDVRDPSSTPAKMW